MLHFRLHFLPYTKTRTSKFRSVVRQHTEGIVDYYLAIQRSVWRDIKFAFVFFVCTVENISTQDGAIGVKFWIRVEQTS